MKLLVITSMPDPHVDMVVEHLPGGVVPIVFDPKMFPDDEEVSFQMSSGITTVTTAVGQLSDIISIWYRKPLLLRQEDMPVPDSYKKLAHGSYKESVVWFYSNFPDKLWVSDYWRIMESNSKIYQMQVAQKFGLLLPDTLVTSSAVQAQKFLDIRQSVVVKPLNIDFVDVEGTLMASYATRLTADEQINLTGLKVSPAIFQQEVIGLDIRVTVVGNEVFPCVIEKVAELSSKADWRMGFYDGNIRLSRDAEFPPVLARKCVEMINNMGLKFGAFDFIKDAGGNYWFLEVNPNGQWGFIELATGMAISQSFARLLTSPLS